MSAAVLGAALENMAELYCKFIVAKYSKIFMHSVYIII